MINFCFFYSSCDSRYTFSHQIFEHVHRDFQLSLVRVDTTSNATDSTSSGSFKTGDFGKFIYSVKLGTKPVQEKNPSTLWFPLEDMLQLIVTPQGIEKVTIQLKDTPTKVYAVGAKLFLSQVPLDVLQN